MARPCGGPAVRLDLTPPTLDLCLYEGKPDRLVVTREDSDVPGVPLSMVGWSDPTAVFRVRKGQPPAVDLLPVLNGDQIDIVVTETMKAAFVALGTRSGVWEVDITNDIGDLVTLVRGRIEIQAEVVTV